MGLSGRLRSGLGGNDARVGDASAFGLVMDCIAYGTAIVERHGGALVKTIGDALMAAFVDPKDAAAAGAEMLVLWPDFVQGHPLAGSINLKVGVFAGGAMGFYGLN